ncbi:aliphatic sulfonate ABC transporter substrate-binding protein [Nostoc sp.]|uniref:aliphatic sulfonate ABC transporter substrate-binding protein n=2 Tax=Nostoc sp. TaxID=1180 RepID=UPI002FFA181A
MSNPHLYNNLGNHSKMSRRDFFNACYGLMGLSTALVSCNTKNSNTRLVRLGYQNSGDLIAHEKKVIEKRLAPLGVDVQWSLFVSGPPLLEALDTGSIDLGPTGETPPIFAQASGSKLVYLVNIPGLTAEAKAIIVPKDSSIRTLTDLKGKKVAFARGTALTYFLVKALEEVGLKLSDIKPVNLTTIDGRSAFLNKTVDAFVASDPSLLQLQRETSIRVLRDGKGIETPGGYYLASREFATNNPDLLKAILEEYYKVGQWTNNNRREAAAIIAPKTKVDPSMMELLLTRRNFDMKPITEQVISAQQQVADLLYQLKIIPKQVDVRLGTLSPTEYAAITPNIISSK